MCCYHINMVSPTLIVHHFSLCRFSVWSSSSAGWALTIKSQGSSSTARWPLWAAGSAWAAAWSRMSWPPRTDTSSASPQWIWRWSARRRTSVRRRSGFPRMPKPVFLSSHFHSRPVLLFFSRSPVFLKNHHYPDLPAQPGDHVHDAAPPLVLHGGHEQRPGVAHRRRPEHRLAFLHCVLVAVHLSRCVRVQCCYCSSVTLFGTYFLLFKMNFQWREWKLVRP